MINKVNANPFIKGFNGYAIPLSILTKDNDEYNILLYNDYLNIRYLKGLFAVEFYCYKYLNICNNALNTISSKIPKGIAKSSDLVLNIINNFLNNGYYLVFFANEYYIPHRKKYMSGNYDHDSLLFGYNEDNYYILGYSDKSLYETSTLTENELINGIKGINNDDMCLYFLKPNIAFKPNFNITRCITSLRAYIYSTDPYCICNENEISGINSYNILIKEMKEIYNEKSELDYRPFYVIYEHTKIVMSCLIYLQNNNYLNSNQLVTQYNTILQGWKMISFLSVKFNLNKSKNIIEKIEKYIPYYVTQEENILKQIIKDLEIKNEG